MIISPKFALGAIQVQPFRGYKAHIIEQNNLNEFGDTKILYDIDTFLEKANIVRL